MNEIHGNQPDKNKRPHAGLILILVGAALFVLNNFRGPTDTIIFFLVGGMFLAGYFLRGVYGLLIPACILIGLGIGSLAEDSSLPISNFNFVGLGIGFVAISVIDLIYRRRAHWWPLIPGMILIVVGAGSEYLNLGELFAKGWPLILVLIGIFMWMGIIGRSKEDK
jgi:hypothetical protein